jgi:hypothetical protein
MPFRFLPGETIPDGARRIKARTLGDRIFADKAKALTRRWHRWWNAWSEETARADAPALESVAS